MANNRYLVDIMADVVDSMRNTGNITNSVEDNGVYTLTSVNTFSNLDSIIINDVTYQVSNVTSTTFKISANTGLDFTGDEWKEAAPYYIYGHPIEIASRLSQKDKNDVKKYQKYPLIVLITDFTESHNVDDVRIDYTVSPTVLIITSTDKTYNSEQRYEFKFKPILYPLYISFLEKLDESPELNTVDDELIDHSKTDRLFWGASGTYGNTGNIFNDNLDAIELNFNDLEVVINNDEACQ